MCHIFHDSGTLGQKYRALWEGQPFPDPPPPAPWPRLARWLATLRTPEDLGLGDTIARHLDRFGAKAMQRLYEKLTGKPCGCADRRAALNRLYGYQREP